jgi:flagellar hook-associated protein 1 FlgK
MGLFEGLSIGRRGLEASQLAMNVTGQNISNANTDGYSRKRVALAADYRVDGALGQMGFGVDIRFVERIRNEFIDRQLIGQTTQKGYTDELDQGYARLENIHQEPSDTGIASAVDNFWNAWSDVANNPGDRSSREALKSTAMEMTDRLHYTSNEIRAYKLSINDQIADYTTKINNLTSQISEMNGVIVNNEGLDTQRANDSRDNRDQLVKELSDIISITYVEDAAGAISVTSGGTMLVSPSKASTFENVREIITDPDGYKYSNNTLRIQGAESSYTATGGRLKALFDMRDNVLTSYETELNGMVSKLVENVNAVHNKGFTLDRLTGVDFFDNTGVSCSTISLSAAVLTDSNSIAAAKGGNLVAISAAGPIASDLNNIVDLPTFNPLYRNLAEGSVRVVNSVTGAVLEEGADKDYVIDNELGRVKIINTATYPSGTNFSIDFKYNDQGFSGSGDGSNAIEIALIRDKKIMDDDGFGNYTHTMSEYYGGYIGRLGVERNQASTELETQVALIEQINGQQQ